MKNFCTKKWIQTLSQFNFGNIAEASKGDIDTQAKLLSEQINCALDIIAPKKFITIKPDYVQGLSDSTKQLMHERDLTRSKLRKQSMSYPERKSLTMK